MSAPLLPPDEFLAERSRHVLREGNWPGEEDHYLWWEPSECGDPLKGMWCEGGLLCGSSCSPDKIAGAAVDGKIVYVGPVAELPAGDGGDSVERSAEILRRRLP